jgi:hypothetical protein
MTFNEWWEGHGAVAVQMVPSVADWRAGYAIAYEAGQRNAALAPRLAELTARVQVLSREVVQARALLSRVLEGDATATPVIEAFLEATK